MLKMNNILFFVLVFMLVAGVCMKLKLVLFILFFTALSVFFLYVQFMDPERDVLWRILGILMGVFAGWNANRLIKEIFGTHL